MEFETINVKNIYEDIADEFSDKRYNKWDWIEEFINNNNDGALILDVGCGNGRNMINNKYIFYGIDNCVNFIKISQQKNLNVLLSDMTTIPFIDNYFDSIMSIASFHHLSNVDRRLLCLSELKRVLKPSGSLLLSVWSINQTHNKKLNNKFVYGDNIIPWKDNKGNIKGNRYYYIFNIDEIITLLNKFFIIKKHFWNHGNEIFILHNMI